MSMKALSWSGWLDNWDAVRGMCPLFASSLLTCGR
jgi:hypothetical protein